MKRVLITSIILIALLLAGCGTPATTSEQTPSQTAPTTPTEPAPKSGEVKLSSEPAVLTTAAEFTINSFDQLGPYVTINYEVQNTGEIHIGYYKVYFTVTCDDGSHQQHQAEGKHVFVGYKWSDHTILKLEDKKVISIDITDFELTAGKVPEVIYEITGTAKKVNITLNNATGGTEQYSDIYIPAKQTYSSFYDDFLYISAQNQGESGSVIVSIYVNGNLFKASRSSGAYVIATASGSK